MNLAVACFDLFQCRGAGCLSVEGFLLVKQCPLVIAPRVTNYHEDRCLSLLQL